MPIPKPRKDEPQKKFHSRCMSFLVGEGRPGNEANAICYDQWRNKEEPPEETTPLEEPHGIPVNRERESVLAGQYPEPEDIELPEGLKPRHQRSENFDLDQRLEQP